ncbi:type I-G CRISPR-associated protein Cas8g1/Csx17 [Phytoactinopolyspora halophila]|nr:type I-U CRISPR-associated protein Csx17 [Phytoactinopolyspora halophila]
MPELPLAGYRGTPLGSYLWSLGTLRAVSRLFDSDARGAWRGGQFILHSRFDDVDKLVAEFERAFEPAPVISPWNKEAGFASSTGTKAALLDWVRTSDDPRLGALRRTIAAAESVVDRARERGWGGSGSDFWDKKYKPKVIQMCRNEFPDEALPWLDVATTLTQDAKIAFSRLLGTGGVFGRQELSSTYLARVQTVLTHESSQEWLRSLLTGSETIPYLRDPVGQFDPGRAGGIHSSPFEKKDEAGFANPWAFILTLEGVLLLASAVVRRHGAEYDDAALPFQVRGTTSAFATATDGETVHGEFWAPLWSDPLDLAAVEHLLSEGRADWRGKPARSGLDFARAVANLGVDRGIDTFERFIFADRFGQNPFAVPAGRVAVQRRPGVELLAGLDRWLRDVDRSRSSRGVAAEIHRLEDALFTHASSGSLNDLVDVFVALGRCHEAVARSGHARGRTRPLILRDGRAIAYALQPAVDDDAQLRVALALATAHDPKQPPTLGGIRPYVSPVVDDHGRPAWSERPAPASLAAGLIPALGVAARYRSMPRPNDDTTESEVAPAVRGARIVHTYGMRALAEDVFRLATGHLDEVRTAELLAGFLTVDWSTAQLSPPARRRTTSTGGLDFMLPFSSDQHLDVPNEDGTTSPTLLRPGRAWPAQLRAGRSTDVLRDAARRLRISGVPGVVTPAPTNIESDRLAACLMLAVSDRDRLASLARISTIPSERKEPIHA